ncbi:MAG: hypothetical protein HGA72_07300, partial [Chlorobiaceae bacterium]|nr:hypothetical protein [Chlorobiaceae bacterium]
LGALHEQRIVDRAHDLQLASDVGRAVSEKAVDLDELLTSAVETIRAALGRLEAIGPPKGPQIEPSAEAPTHRQGQFLAYICEYMRQNSAGLAPTHAAMQRFFGLTALYGEHY